MPRTDPEAQDLAQSSLHVNESTDRSHIQLAQLAQLTQRRSSTNPLPPQWISAMFAPNPWRILVSTGSPCHGMGVADCVHVWIDTPTVEANAIG